MKERLQKEGRRHGDGDVYPLVHSVTYYMLYSTVLQMATGLRETLCIMAVDIKGDDGGPSHALVIYTYSLHVDGMSDQGRSISR